MTHSAKTLQFDYPPLEKGIFEIPDLELLTFHLACDPMQLYDYMGWSLKFLAEQLNVSYGTTKDWSQRRRKPGLQSHLTTGQLLIKYILMLKAVFIVIRKAQDSVEQGDFTSVKLFYAVLGNS
jgi:hypothetical protein